MNKEKFDYAKKNMGCIAGGVKESCLIVREFLNHSKINEDGSIIASNCAVDTEEFKEAVSILLANSFENSKTTDFVPPFYECDSDCSKNDYIFCPGEFQISKNKTLTKKMCPYYSDSSNI